MNLKIKAQHFLDLHHRQAPFLIPNPWDVGSGRLLAGLGFSALATTSSGLAYTFGRADGQVTFEEKLAHCRALSAAVTVPVSADLEDGFANEPAAAASNIARAATTGIVGGSIEDYSRDPSQGIYDFNLAVERVQAAVEAVRVLDFHFTLTARAENLLHGRDDLDDTIRRLQAFEAAGADVLYAPGLKTLEEIELVKTAVNKPLNVLAPLVPGATIAEMGAAGAQRISIGGALARAVLKTIIDAGREMNQDGTFGWLDHLATGQEIDDLLKISRT